MLPRLLIAIAIATAPLHAAAAPRNVQQCLKEAFTLAREAQAKSLSSATKRVFKQQLSVLEDHCDKKQFREADIVSKALRRLIAR